MHWTAEVIERFSPYLMSVFRGKRVEWHDAEELTQETFIEVWKYLERKNISFVDLDELRPLLYVNAGWRLIEFWRRRNGRGKPRRRIVCDLSVVDSAPASAAGLSQYLVHDNTGCDERMEFLETLLGNESADLIWLVFCGYSSREIAELRGYTVAAVKTLLTAAKRKLRETCEFRECYGERS